MNNKKNYTPHGGGRGENLCLRAFSISYLPNLNQCLVESQMCQVRGKKKEGSLQKAEVSQNVPASGQRLSTLGWPEAPAEQKAGSGLNCLSGQEFISHPKTCKVTTLSAFSVSQVKVMDELLCIGRWIWAQFKYFYLYIHQQSCQTMR